MLEITPRAVAMLATLAVLGMVLGGLDLGSSTGPTAQRAVDETPQQPGSADGGAEPVVQTRRAGPDRPSARRDGGTNRWYDNVSEEQDR